jgi:RNA polymerase sigma-70 factor (ECF subfamily)
MDGRPRVVVANHVPGGCGWNASRCPCAAVGVLVTSPPDQRGNEGTVDTSLDLLRRAQLSFGSEAWNRFVRIYTPLIARWLGRFGISETDVPDLTQDVLLTAAMELREFEHNGRRGAFRTWLRLIARNRCRRHWERHRREISLEAETMLSKLDELADPQCELIRTWDREHDAYVLRGLFDALERYFDPKTLQVFHEVMFLEQSPVEVARKHGWPVGRVYKAKFRVIQRLRENGQRFLE